MLRLLLITNNPKVASIADKAGVDWIFIDLETKGKQKRQAGRNTVISSHTVDDIIKVKKILQNSKVLVRINPLGEWSKTEINRVIEAGADIIMLPYFKSAKEVEIFLSLVNKRVNTCLLLETLEAIDEISKILKLEGIDFIHIGLNDIHIQRKTDFMFEFLADGYIDEIAEQIKKYNIPFGFGGVAHMDSPLIPLAKDIIAEHYRVGSTGVILSRSFIDVTKFNDEKFADELESKVKKLRYIEKTLIDKDKSFFDKNKIIVKNDIYKVRDMLRKQKEEN